MNGLRKPSGKSAGALPEPYVTKDASLIKELVNPACHPGLGMSLAEAGVAAGESTIPHCHTTFDEIYYCLEGAGVLFINDVSHPFSPGSYHLLPKGSRHYLTATTRLRFLCVCAPGYTHEDTVLLANTM